jgi:cell wall assembly regulator SMI1
MPRDLSRLDTLLAQLEAVWREQGAPTAEQLAAGLSDDELDRYERVAGLTFPAEIRRWWHWHDGVRRRFPDAREEPGSVIGVGHWDFLSCAEALEERAVMMRTAPRTGDDEVDVFWRPTWLPMLTSNADRVFVDCARALPTVHIWHKVPDDLDTVRAESWTDAVAFWVRMLTERYYFWSPEEGAWRDRWEELPPQLRVDTLL